MASEPQPTPASPHPNLDAFKAQLAAMSPERRKTTLAQLAEAVRKRLAEAPHSPPPTGR